MAKRTGEKYDAIIEAAVRVIAKHGYHNAHVTKIAKEANVADGTIYLYFENKDDVLISLFQEKMGQFVATVQENIGRRITAKEKLHELIRTHLAQLAADKDLAIVTQIELRQSNPIVREAISETLKQYFRIIDSIVKLGIEEGVFSENIDLRMARMMIFGTLDETVTAWVMKDGKFDLLEGVDSIHSLFLSGLSGK
ncbi:TetR family transcriptional regulator [Microaerobacter geothermalis]|uniref:TetR/AcrR family transcriptional regulator n=1 Tax=Microaerobacter geothermalis TaxID=674972 RepID=UPI001F3A1949|nr:TetR/AcrR family transcriptional regulator [Microaerobacter geothermalis]MCF6092603.1 TetR family transcriptional regulator [Microaerobacter geothermalis]